MKRLYRVSVTPEGAGLSVTPVKIYVAAVSDLDAEVKVVREFKERDERVEARVAEVLGDVIV
jgi:hypothetical protein